MIFLRINYTIKNKTEDSDDPVKLVEDYIRFFNEKRPAYALNYMTPVEYKAMFYK